MKRLVLALSCSLISAAASAVPVVTVNGNLYEIGTVTGLLSDHRSTIESQVWFGNSALARTLANEVGTVFGTPNHQLYGPMFGYYVYDGIGADYTTGWVYTPDRYNLAEDNRAQVNNATAGNYYTYATGKYVGVAAIPEPSSFLLFAFGLLMLIGRKELHGRFRSGILKRSDI
jgi:hypothetical protein